MNIVIITSCLAPTTGVFTPEERTEQTKVSIRTAREQIPGCKVILTDVSLFPISELRKQIYDQVDIFLNGNGDENIVNYSKIGHKSRGELLLFKSTLDFIKDNIDLKDYKRIFKLSGRHNITKEFDIKEYDDRTEGKYVFKKAVKSWIDPNWRLFETRLWSLSTSNIDNYLEKFPYFFNSCDGRFDIEHAYYRFLNQDDVVQFDNIWVEGCIAPNGRYQKD